MKLTYKDFEGLSVEEVEAIRAEAIRISDQLRVATLDAEHNLRQSEYALNRAINRAEKK